jgi:hypothetical protein
LNKLVSEILKDARALITEETAWQRYTLGDSYGGRYCSIGAVYQAYRNAGESFVEETDSQLPALVALRRCIEASGIKGATTYNAIGDLFNDRGATTHADVLAKFDEAIAKAEAEENKPASVLRRARDFISDPTRWKRYSLWLGGSVTTTRDDGTEEYKFDFDKIEKCCALGAIGKAARFNFGAPQEFWPAGVRGAEQLLKSAIREKHPNAEVTTFNDHIAGGAEMDHAKGHAEVLERFDRAIELAEQAEKAAVPEPKPEPIAEAEYLGDLKATSEPEPVSGGDMPVDCGPAVSSREPFTIKVRLTPPTAERVRELIADVVDELSLEFDGGIVDTGADKIREVLDDGGDGIRDWLKDAASYTDEQIIRHLAFSRAPFASLKATLLEKNKAYGNSALDPVRIFSKADAVEQIKVRIDDKLSRIKRGTELQGEDSLTDLRGYLVLLEVAKRAGLAS